MKSFVFDKVPARTLKLTTIGHRRRVIAYCWADGKLLFFILPASSYSGTGFSKYDNGTYTKHLHKTKTKRRDSISENSKTLFAMSHINNLSIM